MGYGFSSELRAISDTVEPYGVCFLADSGAYLAHMGSGVLFSVAEGAFVLTAAHVARDLADAADAVLLGCEDAHAVRLGRADVLVHDRVDIAVVPLTDGCARNIREAGRRFLRGNLLDPESGGISDLMLVHGYRHRPTLREPTHGHLVPQKLCYFTHEFGSSSETDLILAFERKIDSHLDRPDGMSGCGVWRVTGRTPRLCGIQHQFNAADMSLTAARIGVAVNMLHSEWPDLRPSLALHFRR
jgi:hypothetical protein